MVTITFIEFLKLIQKGKAPKKIFLGKAEDNEFVWFEPDRGYYLYDSGSPVLLYSLEHHLFDICNCNLLDAIKLDVTILED